LAKGVHGESSYLRAILDAIPSWVFIMDDSCRVIDSNLAASLTLGEEAEVVLTRLSGEALHCIHAAEGIGVCGTTRFREDCVIRDSIGSAIHGKTVVRFKTELQLLRKKHSVEKIYVHVTASPFVFGGITYALLIIEDITEVTELREILPICVSCKRIRDDKEYWEHVESYLGKYLDLRFTHSICPECAKRLYPDFFRA
jgi:PAS domain-containing protein